MLSKISSGKQFSVLIGCSYSLDFIHNQMKKNKNKNDERDKEREKERELKQKL